MVKKERFFYGYIIVAAVFILQVAMYGPRSSFGVFFKPIIADTGWSRALVSGAFSTATVTQGLFSVVMGSLNDRFGPRVVMTLCGGLIGVGYLLMSQIQAAWQFYLFYTFIIGVGMGSLYAPLMATVARWFVKRRNIMTGLAMAGGGTGGLIIPLLFNLLITTRGWRTSYFAMGAMVLVVTVLAAQLLRRDPSQKGLEPYGQGASGGNMVATAVGSFSVREAARTGRFWMMLAISYCILFSYLTLLVHIVPHATDLGITPATAAGILAAMSTAHLSGGILMGALADRIGSRRVVAVCFILMAAALAWLPAIREAWMFFIFAVLLGLGGGGATTLISPLAADLFGTGALGLIIGIFTMGASAGSASGPFLAGYIFDATGSYRIAFTLTLATAIVGLAITLLLRPGTNRPALPPGPF